MNWKIFVVILVALGVFGSAYADSSDDYWAAIDAAEAAFKRGDDDEAIRIYTRLIDLREFSPEDQGWSAFSGRGDAWARKGSYDRAIADYDVAIRLRPHAYYYYSRGEAWARKGDYDRAIADYDAAIRFKPSVLHYTGRAYAWVNKGKLDRAIADLDEALRLDPQFSPALRYRETLVEKRGGKAAAGSNQAAPSKTAEQNFAEGFAHLQAGRLIGAQQSFESGLEGDATNALALYYLGVTYSQLKKPITAETYFQRSLDADPQSTVAAKAREALSRLPRALLAALTEAADNDVQRGPFRLNGPVLAKLRDRNPQYSDAVDLRDIDTDRPEGQAAEFIGRMTDSGLEKKLRPDLVSLRYACVTGGKCVTIRTTQDYSFRIDSLSVAASRARQAEVIKLLSALKGLVVEEYGEK